MVFEATKLLGVLTGPFSSFFLRLLLLRRSSLPRPKLAPAYSRPPPPELEVWGFTQYGLPEIWYGTESGGPDGSIDGVPEDCSEAGVGSWGDWLMYVMFVEFHRFFSWGGLVVMFQTWEVLRCSRPQSTGLNRPSQT